MLQTFACRQTTTSRPAEEILPPCPPVVLQRPTRFCAPGRAEGPKLELGPAFITGGHTWVEGRTNPAAQVYVNAVNIQVNSEGKFKALVAVGNEWRTISVAAYLNEKPGCTERVIRRDPDPLTRADFDFMLGIPTPQDPTATTATITTTGSGDCPPPNSR